MTEVNILRLWENSIVEILEEWDLDHDEIENKAPELLQSIREDCKNKQSEIFKQSAPDYLLTARTEIEGFEERNFSRWRPAFDHIEMMWKIASELGEANVADFIAEGNDVNDPTMTALSYIFPKSLLVVQEIVCLLKGGYPDGALTRWRSLHELAVTAIFIAMKGDKVANEYLMSFNFSARRAACQVNDFSHRSGIERFSTEEMDELDAKCAQSEGILGRKIANDANGEWPKISGYKSIADIEKEVGLDHWRPWYKWASQHTHANHRPLGVLLGNSESSEPSNLVGASNSGFVDPFQLTALSLSQLVATFLKHCPNFDRVVHIEVFGELAREMYGIASQVERESLEKHVKGLG